MLRGSIYFVMWRQHILGLLFALAVVALTWVVTATGASASSYTAQTSRRYSMMVEELTASLDEADTTPTLVSVLEEISLTLPAKPGARAAAWEGGSETSEMDDMVAEQLTFDEDFDPIWYFLLRRRGFEHLDWSGCGGKWRPEWSMPKTYKGHGGYNGDSASLSTESAHERYLFASLRRYLAHHTVCTYSSVSFCGASRERDPASHFQWAAQFVSTLTSSPLSWTEATPRHSRPAGVVLQNNFSHAGGDDVASWCSYHLVYHDTLCTQHVNPLINVGRPGRGAQEGLPHGIFKAVFPSFVKYFGSPFQHFSVRATEERRPGNGTAAGPPTVQLKVEFRMSMVADEASDMEALRDLWSKELPLYARDGRLQVHIGPGGLSQPLRSALPATALVPSSTENQAEVSAPAASSSKDLPSQFGRTPEVHYEVRSHGKVHGHLNVELYPAAALMDTLAGMHGENLDDVLDDGQAATQRHDFYPREGDVVRTLLLFPLHLVRPSLHNMESLLGSTRIVYAYTDTFSNTLAVLLETTLTSVHIAAYGAAYEHAQQCHGMAGRGGGIGARGCRTRDGVLLGRFQLFFGWSALVDMPADDNSNRIVPQPVVAIHRAASVVDLDAAGKFSEFDFCRMQRRYAASLGEARQLDHQDSLAALFEMLNGTYMRGKGRMGGPPAETEAPRHGDTCVYWVQSTVASGTTIPSPDSAMVFNVLSIGLLFSALGAGMLVRLTRRLTCRGEDLAQFLAKEGSTNPIK